MNMGCSHCARLQAENAQWRVVAKFLLDDLAEPADIDSALARIRTDVPRLLRREDVVIG